MWKEKINKMEYDKRTIRHLLEVKGYLEIFNQITRGEIPQGATEEEEKKIRDEYEKGLEVEDLALLYRDFKEKFPFLPFGYSARPIEDNYQEEGMLELYLFDQLFSAGLRTSEGLNVRKRKAYGEQKTPKEKQEYHDNAVRVSKQLLELFDKLFPEIAQVYKVFPETRRGYEYDMNKIYQTIESKNGLERLALRESMGVEITDWEDRLI